MNFRVSLLAGLAALLIAGTALALEGDIDEDGVPDEQDNCVDSFNPDQIDTNGNGVGDACDSGVPAVFLVIDEDSIDNGNRPNRFSARDVNDDIAEIGVRAQLRYFAANQGQTITLATGQVGDEGWFELRTIPESWAAAGGLPGFIGDPSAPAQKPPPPHGVGPGLGAPDANGDRESLLDKVPDVTPLRKLDLEALVGRVVCAVVFDSDISINYQPLNGSLKGANLGTVAFEVVSNSGGGSSTLPAAQVTILDARQVCLGLPGGSDD